MLKPGEALKYAPPYFATRPQALWLTPGSVPLQRKTDVLSLLSSAMLPLRNLSVHAGYRTPPCRFLSDPLGADEL
eukprot:9466207-Pyramimonas_sp.AAC.3